MGSGGEPGWRPPGSGLTGRAAGRAAAASRRHVDADAEAGADISVLGSGNLGLLYVHSATRLTLDDLQQRWPNLIPGLCAHEGIGFIAGLDAAGRPWAISADGSHRLDTGEVTGEDPLRCTGHAARMLQRAVVMPEAPDLYLNSRVDDVTLDIAAFEPLVGAHGGLGGWQDRCSYSACSPTCYPRNPSRGRSRSRRAGGDAAQSDNAGRYPQHPLSPASKIPDVNLSP